MYNIPIRYIIQIKNRCSNKRGAFTSTLIGSHLYSTVKSVLTDTSLYGKNKKVLEKIKELQCIKTGPQPDFLYYAHGQSYFF